MKYLASSLLLGLLLFGIMVFAKPVTTFFKCTVHEPKVRVTVKFAVKDLDIFEGKGELVPYPGTNEDEGMIYVSPKKSGKYHTLMTNLNGQGGDLRIEGDHLRLFGDGAGYQFTELVIWDLDQAEFGNPLDGYVRDFGPTYGKEEFFRQFIKCTMSQKVL